MVGGGWRASRLPTEPHKYPTGRESAVALCWAALPSKGTELFVTAKQRVDICSWHLVGRPGTAKHSTPHGTAPSPTENEMECVANNCFSPAFPDTQVQPISSLKSAPRCEEAMP